MSSPTHQVARSHRELIVWQRALELIEEVYRISGQLPPKETYGIMTQVRRAAVSVAANIAEGHARRSPKEYARFLSIAIGSLREVQTYAEICERLKYLSPDQLATAVDLAEQVAKMLTRLRLALMKQGARRTIPPDPLVSSESSVLSSQRSVPED
jgi:four helix bundle protein